MSLLLRFHLNATLCTPEVALAGFLCIQSQMLWFQGLQGCFFFFFKQVAEQNTNVRHGETQSLQSPPNALFCKRKPVDENTNGQPDRQSNQCSSSSPTLRHVNFPLCTERHLENHCLASCKHSTGSVPPPKPPGQKLSVKTLANSAASVLFRQTISVALFSPEGDQHFVFFLRCEHRNLKMPGVDCELAL